MKKVTINDVAREAGVAKSTVSRAFTPGESVSEKTRDRVNEVARRLGYAPNPLAKALSVSRTGIVAVVVPNIESIHISQIIRGVMSVMNKKDYSIITLDSSENYGREASVIKPLSHQLVDGLINCYGSASEDIALISQKKPVVCIGDEPSGYQADFVSIDYRQGFGTIISHLRENGCRRPVLIQGKEENSTRAQGELFCTLARDQGLDMGMQDVMYANWTPYYGYRETQKAFRRTPRPDALVYASDFMAFGGLKALDEAGISVPGDIRVCGLDDSLVSKYTVPSLTTLKFSPFHLGMEAAKLMIRRLEQGSLEPMQTILPVSLSARTSTQMGETQEGENQ